jgi:hypothetical protein
MSEAYMGASRLTLGLSERCRVWEWNLSAYVIACKAAIVLRSER